MKLPRAVDKILLCLVPSGDEKRNEFQVEKFQQGEIGTEEKPEIVGEIARWNFPTRAEIYKERCEFPWEQEKERRKECPKVCTAAASETSEVCPRARRLTTSKYSKRHPCGTGHIIKASCREHLTTQDRGRRYEHPEGGMKKVTTLRRTSTRKKSSLEAGKAHKRGSVENEQTCTGEEPFQCPQCGMSFSRKRKMEWHQSTHTGKKPFGCSQCAQSFNQKSDLVRHQRIHTGEKPYQCHDCKKSFSRRDSLIGHQLTHAGVKWRKWPDPERFFCQREKLIRRQRTCEEDRDLVDDLSVGRESGGKLPWFKHRRTPFAHWQFFSVWVHNLFFLEGHIGRMGGCLKSCHLIKWSASKFDFHSSCLLHNTLTSKLATVPAFLGRSWVWPDCLLLLTFLMPWGHQMVHRAFLISFP